MLGLNPWVLLGVGLAWLASVGAVGYLQRQDGGRAERLICQTNESAALKQVNATIERLNTEARAQERSHQIALFTIGEKHEQERQAAEVQRRRDVDAARRGDLRLRVAGACAPRPSGAGEASAAAPVGDGRTDAELPRETAAALLELADAADEIVLQLAACQAVIRSDRQ